MRYCIFVLTLLLTFGSAGISAAQEETPVVHRLPPLEASANEPSSIKQVSAA